jgi:hypothetical protein
MWKALSIVQSAESGGGELEPLMTSAASSTRSVLSAFDDAQMLWALVQPEKQEALKRGRDAAGNQNPRRIASAGS